MFFKFVVALLIVILLELTKSTDKLVDIPQRQRDEGNDLKIFL